MSLDFARKYLKDHGIQAGLTSTLIADRALARGIEVRPDARGRLSMRRRGKVVWFNGAKSNINSTLVKRCAQHKHVTSSLLRTYGVNAPKNLAFWPHDLAVAWKWAQSIGSVVVKPPNGGLGKSVHMDIQSFDEFQAAFTSVAEETGEVLVEEFIHGVEHRVLMIYGQVAAAARRVPANVVGNGHDDVAALIEHKNFQRRESQNPAHWEIAVDELSVNELARQGLTLESIPGEGQQVWLRSNSNVHSGGDGVDATDELTPEEIDMAQRAVRTIRGLKLAGLDMILPRQGQGTEPYVLEVNAQPMITGHHYPWCGQQRDVAGMLVDAMFPGIPSLRSAREGAADQGYVSTTSGPSARKVLGRVAGRLGFSRRT